MIRVLKQFDFVVAMIAAALLAIFASNAFPQELTHLTVYAPPGAKVTVNGVEQIGTVFHTRLTEPYPCAIVVTTPEIVSMGLDPFGRGTGPVYKKYKRTITLRPGVDAVEAFAGAVPTAIDEVNAARATRGLPPFVHDPQLSLAAHSVATYRAERGIEGHANDFAHLPPGVDATAAGCAAWPAHYGWGACCTYEGWRYCGAAFVVGRDGRRYMHLFVR